ncbi:hypothetical protein, partial [Pseudomonas sp. FW305-62]|uniref:hypothetical protein n=1 Tax=Pseudomonas sp. FW305-62 TaxID=2070641 RepID=UPI001C43F883
VVNPVHAVYLMQLGRMVLGLLRSPAGASSLATIPAVQREHVHSIFPYPLAALFNPMIEQG